MLIGDLCVPFGLQLPDIQPVIIDDCKDTDVTKVNAIEHNRFEKLFQNVLFNKQVDKMKSLNKKQNGIQKKKTKKKDKKTFRKNRKTRR